MIDKPIVPRARVSRAESRRLEARTIQENAKLATVTRDDVQHAQQTARALCTAPFRRYLAAALDTTDRTGAA